MGRPKAWLPFGGETLLQRVVRIVREVVNPVVVVTATGQDVPELPLEVRIVCDEIEGQGPLAGLAAGLGALEGEADAAYLSACDVPFLKPAFMRRVMSFLASGARQGTVSSENSDLTVAARPGVAVPRICGHFHPLAAVFRLSILPHVRERLAANRLRMLDLFDAVPTRVIEPHELLDVDPDFASLRNLNTPEEYAAALGAIEQPGG